MLIVGTDGAGLEGMGRFVGALMGWINSGCLWDGRFVAFLL